MWAVWNPKTAPLPNAPQIKLAEVPVASAPNGGAMPYGGAPGGGGGGPFPPRLLVRRKQDRMGGRGLSEGEPYPGPVHQLQFRCVARLEAARPRCR